MCGQLVRVAMIEEASLPGIDEVKKLTVRRRREKLKSLKKFNATGGSKNLMPLP